MSNNVTLSLPLSATALRLGATLLTDLAAQTETIYAELTGMNPFYEPNRQIDTYAAGLAYPDGLGGAQDVKPEEFGTVININLPEGTTLEQDVQAAEAETVNKYANETPEEKQFRLHGNVASAGMEPAPGITQETLPPLQYETVVIGHAPGPVPFAEGHDQESYEEAGWSIQAMIDAGHLVEVTEQRPKEGVHSVSAAPSAIAPAPAPAPAAPAPSGSGVAVDKAGLPYDARIHSSAAEPLAKTGFWKRKKNLSDEYVAEIEAELRGVMNAGKPNATGAAEPAMTTTATPANTAPAPTPAPTTTTVAAAAPPAPSAPAAPAPAPAPGVAPAAPATNAFATFTRWILDHKLSPTDVVLEVQKLGLTQIPDLGKRPDLIPQVVVALQAKGLGL